VGVPCFIWFDFILLGAILEPVPALPWPEAPGAGCIGSVCADAIAVAPNNEAATRAEIANLDRMRNLPLLVVMLRFKTADANLCSKIEFCSFGNVGQRLDFVQKRHRHN
jgi:hypothetical protein